MNMMPRAASAKSSIVSMAPLVLSLQVLLLCAVLRGAPMASAQQADDGQCSVSRRTREDGWSREVVTVGVLGIRGPESAWAEFNLTFGPYLTSTAGRRFDPPLAFEMKALDFITLFSDVEEANIDFIYVNPSAYSCIESQYGARSLVSQISRRVVGDNVYSLTMFGGVIFARADDDAVNTIEDLRGKSIAAASISGLGSGQMQARVLQQRGLSYINDPAQLVFTSDQNAIVRGVLSGEFDVGWVRTDQIERTKDSSGNIVDRSKLKVIEPIPGLNIDGEPFPFQSSTPLYAEWNVAALPTVSDGVATEVQAALMDLAYHADLGSAIASCVEANCVGPPGVLANATEEDCRAECARISVEEYISGGPGICDIDPETALVAHDARNAGGYTGFRSVLSYMDLRNMQEETGFISRDPETGITKCVRSEEIYDAIVCPPGHFKKSPDQVASGCADANRTCGEGYQCICKPCVKAFEVDVFPASSDEDAAAGATPVMASASEGSVQGCEKMSLCGSVEQTKSLRFRAVDNKKRAGLNLEVVMLARDETTSIPISSVAAAVLDAGSNSSLSPSYAYEFDVSSRRVGVVILQILANGEQISESPLRVEVKKRACAKETGDSLRVATEDGECECVANSVDINGVCVSLALLLPSILLPLTFLAAVGVYLYVERKRKQADFVWAVKTSELKFDDPPVIVGRGTFGLVLLAEYRGTQVAVKRVIPPRVASVGNSLIRRNSTFGKGDIPSGATNESLDEKGLISVSADRRSSNLFFDLTDEEVDVVEKMENGKVCKGASWAGNERLASGAFNSGAFNSGRGKSSELGQKGDDRKRQSWGEVISKKIKRRDEYQQLKNDFIVEMRYLSKLRHPCITTVMGAVISKKEEPMLVMEYMDHGSLYDVLHNETVFIEGDILLPILRDIAQGIRFLHSATPKVIHGDLKAQNVLVDAKFRAKVADFGLSQKKSVGATGTPFWMAPELLRGESDNSPASDVYSFGIILYEVYSRKDPYEGEKAQDVLRQVVDPNINKRPPVPSAMPVSVSSLMTDCVVGDPESRPNAEEVDLRLKRLDVEHVEPGVVVPSFHTRKDVKSEELLYEVFPKHVADALRDGRRVEPEMKECVTIFFSDIVGFTTISTTMDPMKVSNMLDRLYHRFDDLSRKHDVHKIDTIGDAFMAVTNLVKDQATDHAKRIAEFSIDAIKAAGETPIDLDDPGKGTVTIRVGFHSGPVVADVIGNRTPKYTIFGDTVNTSSRMESNSLPGRIQCSELSAELVRQQAPDILIWKRGIIRVKGKGAMTTYWVNETELTSDEWDMNRSMTLDIATDALGKGQTLTEQDVSAEQAASGHSETTPTD